MIVKPAARSASAYSSGVATKELRGVLGPGQGIGELSVGGPHLLVHREQTTGPQRRVDLSEDSCLVRDVHPDVHQHGGVERAGIEAETVAVHDAELDLITETDSRCQ